MKTIAVFETEEYEKMMETLGLADKDPNIEEDSTEYFNAWHFGQSDEAGNFTLSASL